MNLYRVKCSERFGQKHPDRKRTDSLSARNKSQERGTVAFATIAMFVLRFPFSSFLKLVNLQ
jgi:hypothetical protein